MAFSYSDKNFTVIGNLCFVHIILDGKKRSVDIPPTIDIPPAIADRMLYSQIVCTYPYLSSTSTNGIGFAVITNSKIYLTDVGAGYLYFYFPIDSNK